MGVQIEFFEFGVLADEVFDGVFEGGDDGFECFPVGWGFDVENDVVVDAEFPGDRQGVFGGVSVGVVEDGEHSGALSLVLGALSGLVRRR